MIKMNYCTLCLNPETNPGVSWHGNTCSACHRFDAKLLSGSKPDVKKVGLLQKLLQGKQVAIGVSGGKDSIRQALFLREIIGVEPILISLTSPPEQNTQLGARNLSNLVELNFNVITIHPDPETWRNLALMAFKLFGNYGVATELALYSAPISLCLDLGIEIFMVGENPNFRDGKTFSSQGPEWGYQKLFSQNTLRNGNIDWIKDAISLGQVKFNQTKLFFPPDLEKIGKNLKVIDFSWFIPNWTNLENAVFAASHGVSYMDRLNSMQNGDLEGVSALDDNFVSVNQMIKFYKYGFGKVTDYVNEQIRCGNISRDSGVKLVENHDGTCEDSKIRSFQEFLGITNTEFWETVYRFTNHTLFAVKPENSYRPQKLFSVR